MIKKILPKYTLLLLFSCLSFIGKAQVLFPMEKEQIDIEKEVLLLPNVKKELTIDDIKTKEFIPYKEDKIPSGKSSSWIKFKIKNTSSKKEEVLFATNKFDYISFYSPNKKGNYTISKGGVCYESKKMAISFLSNSYIKLEVAPNSEQWYFAKVEEKDRSSNFFRNMPLPFSLVKESKVTADKSYRTYFLWFFLGALIVMIVYNSVLSFITKERSYLLYVGLLLTILFSL